jgi:hypothetical protein
MGGYRRSDSIGMERINTLDISEGHLLVLHHLPVHPGLHLVRLQRTDKSVVHN